MAQHSQALFYIVACILQNNHKEPSKRLIRFVGNNLELEDLVTIMAIGVLKYNIPAFLDSLTLIIGVRHVLHNNRDEDSENDK
jgi:hypothetical protein